MILIALKIDHQPALVKLQSSNPEQSVYFPPTHLTFSQQLTEGAQQLSSYKTNAQTDAKWTKQGTKCIGMKN